MTNRHSRVIDRARELTKDLEQTGDDERRKLLLEEVQIVYRRARILRLAIILGSISILFVVMTVLSLFAAQVLNLRVEYIAVQCFGLCLLALLGSLYFFLRDVSISLTALELEIAPYLKRP